MPGGWNAFVGRAAELDVLGAALGRAESGDGALVLVGGEPGIGKSSLIDRFAADARRRHARVVWGQCWEAGGAPAYWPFVQVIRTIVRDCDAATIRALTARGGPELAQIVPELRETLVDLTEPSPADSDSARFRLFDAVASLLRSVAVRERPLVVAIEDVHAADAPSLLLLQFVARELHDSSIILVVSYRSTEVTREHALGPTLAELSRVSGARRLSLEGLGPGEISEYVALVTGREVDPAVVETLEARTDGNPLFVSEIIRLMLGDVSSVASSVRLPDEIPVGVREAIARRVARLSKSCRAMLESAAVLGREVPLDMLRALTEVDDDDLLDSIDEAADAGVFVRLPTTAGDVRFSHALVRDALYDRLPTAAKSRGHRRAAEALEQLRAHDLEGYLSEIAHHYIAAGPVADVDTVVRYTALAGESAARRLAYEEAIRLLHSSVALAERSTQLDDTRLDLLLALGDAQATFANAAELARSRDRPDALARSALGYGGRFMWCRAGADATVIPLLEDALEAIGPEDSLLRVRLLARVACARRSDADPTRRRAEGAEAVAIARRIGDARALASALTGYHGAIWEPAFPVERLELTNETLECAAQSGDTEDMINAHTARCVARWELGDFAGACEDVEAMTPLAARLRQPAQRWLVSITRGAVALFEGRFDEVEHLAVEGYNEGRGSLPFDADAAYLTQLALLRLEQGRAGELLDELGRGADGYPWYPHLRALQARLYAADDQRDDARRIVERFAASTYASVQPTDNYSTFSLSLLADVVGEVGDVALAAPLADRLAPFRLRNAMAPPEASVGLVARPLGILYGLLGRVDEATRCFEDAITGHARMGARPWLARTERDYGRMLRNNGMLTSSEPVRGHLIAAATIGHELGMTELTARLGSDGATPARDDTECICRRQGEYWTIAYRGREMRMRHSKGLVYIATLLAHPGRDISAVDLASAADGATDVEERERRVTARAGGELLDATVAGSKSYKRNSKKPPRGPTPNAQAARARNWTSSRMNSPPRQDSAAVTARSSRMRSARANGSKRRSLPACDASQWSMPTSADTSQARCTRVTPVATSPIRPRRSPGKREPVAHGHVFWSHLPEDRVTHVTSIVTPSVQRRIVGPNRRSKQWTPPSRSEPHVVDVSSIALPALP